MNKLHLYLLSAVLALSGTTLFLYKIFVLDFPLVPDRLVQVWTVEAHVSFQARNRPVKIDLLIPLQDARHQIDNENFISRDFGFHVERDVDNRIVVWSVRKISGKQNLFYTATVKTIRDAAPTKYKPPPTPVPTWQGAKRTAAETLVSHAKSRSTDAETMVIELLGIIGQGVDHNADLKLLLGKKPSQQQQGELCADLLSMDAIPARTAHGLVLAEQSKQPAILHWLEVFFDGQWHAFDIQKGEKGVPENYLAWWRGKKAIATATGVTGLDVKLAVAANRLGALQSAVESGSTKYPLFEKFSLFGLPLSAQSVYRVLLLVPVGALILVVLRNLVGLHTFGTFMPILIALAFRETRLLWGLVLFSLLVSMGLAVRLYLEHLKLLVVPRLAAMLSVVILLMLNFSMITHHLGIQMGLSVALFPMVIMTMAIERMSVIWDEAGPAASIRQGIGTLLVAAVVYLVMNQPVIDHLMFVFPELLLVVLSCILLLGRYTGYRLIELFRFKDLAFKGDTNGLV